MSKRRGLKTDGSDSKKSKHEMETHLGVMEANDSEKLEEMLMEIEDGVGELTSFVSEKESLQGDGNRLLGDRSSKASDKLGKKLNNVIDSLDDSPSKVDAISATADTVYTVVESLDKLKSGDPGQVAIGVIDILGSVSQFAAFTGPQGMIVAAVVGPICSIVSSILGAIFLGDQDPPESDEAMLRRVMQELLDKQVSDELSNTAIGVQDELKRMIKYATAFLEAGATGIDDFELQMILDDAYHSAGNQFLGMLQGYITQRHSAMLSANDQDKTKKIDDLLVLYDAYASVMFLRVKLLTMLSSLYKCFQSKCGCTDDSSRSKG